MKNYINKAFAFLSSYSPYFLPSKSPQRIKKLWRRSLLIAPKRYWILVIYTLSIWKVIETIKLYRRRYRKSIKKNQLNNSKILRLIWFDNIPPRYFYDYYFQDPAYWEERHNYLFTSTLSHCVSLWKSDRESEILNEKINFFYFCKKHQFRTPKNYMYVSNRNRQLLCNSLPWNETKDFVLKRNKGSRGIGFIRYTYNHNTNTYQSSENKQFLIPLNQIEKYLKFWFQKETNEYLIQDKLINHSIFTHICNDALASIRIISMVDKNGEIQLFRPIFQMPQGNAILNYYHKGALVTPINLETGKLGKLINIKNTLKSVHPETGNPIEGLVLPYWEELKGEVCRFHKLLVKQPLIGWDIAITPDGPSFLEGNVFPSLDIHQKPPFTPFISSNFYELFLYNLNSALNQTSFSLSAKNSKNSNY